MEETASRLVGMEDSLLSPVGRLPVCVNEMVSSRMDGVL